MARMTGGRALVEMLTRHGVDTLFALPGVQNDALFVALYDAGEAIRVIHPRHEQAAAYMAFGYARASGRPGAFAVVPGPGLLNTTAALATAYATNAPVLCISGQIPSNLIGRGFGLLHEIPDQLAILRGLTKWAERINHPSETGYLVNEAFRQMRHGGRARSRSKCRSTSWRWRARSHCRMPKRAASAAARPGADRAGRKAARRRETADDLCRQRLCRAAAEVLEVAEQAQAPVVTYTGGKGIVSDRHYLAQNLLAGHEWWRGADVVLAVGTRFNQPQTRWGLDGDIKVIRIDLDPVEITRVARPAVGDRRRRERRRWGRFARAGRQGTRLAQGRTRSAEGEDRRPAARDIGAAMRISRRDPRRIAGRRDLCRGSDAGRVCRPARLSGVQAAHLHP